MAGGKLLSFSRSLKREMATNWGVEGPWQWGTIQAIHISASAPGVAIDTVDVYLDNSSSGAGAAITTGLPFLSSYYPTVGDIVLIARMAGAARTQRIVVGSLNSSNLGIATGAAAALIFSDRTGTSPLNWTWYATGGIARLFNPTNGDRLQMAVDGTTTFFAPLKIPPSPGGTIAASSWGSVPVKLSEQVLSSGASTVTFSSIPANFRNWICTIHARSDGSNAQAFSDIEGHVNGDTTALYSGSTMDQSNSATAPTGSGFTTATAWQWMGQVSNSLRNSGAAGHTRIVVGDYSGTTFLKHFDSVDFEGDKGGWGRRVRAGCYASTSGMSSIAFFLSLSDNFIANSVFITEGEP